MTFCSDPNSPWGQNSRQINDFYQSWQWPFNPPIFSKDQFRYKFPKQICLPFTKIGDTKDSASSLFSNVQENSIHVNHLQGSFDIAVDEDGNPRVAIKTLKSLGPDFHKIAEDEAKVLEKMRDFRNEDFTKGKEHLFKAIAYYRKENDYHFMFPWAELGDLWAFWTNTTPKIEQLYIIWMFRQLEGLISAVELLHHQLVVFGADEHCRHGDLKPQNILCFNTKNGQKDTLRLVISDVGLAKLHNKATKWRTDHTSSTSATTRYQPPELGIDSRARRSRRSDIWSMGCIFLEFIVWLLYGHKKLLGFNPEDSFYILDQPSRYLMVGKKKKEKARLHPIVEEWISYIENDWRCSKGTAIRCLVKLIKIRMLEIEVDSLAESPSSPPEKPASIARTTLAKESESILQTTKSTIKLPDSASQIALQPLERQTTYAIPLRPAPKSRAYAPDVREELQAILHGLENGKIEAIGRRPSERAETPPGPLELAQFNEDRGRRGTWMKHNLNDNWDYAPDETIAREVFAGLDSNAILPPPYNSTRLCYRCIGLQLFSTICTFTDSPKELEKKADEEGCALCKLLLQGIQSRVKRYSDFVRFARVGSYLAISDNQSHAIANLYSTPDFLNNSSQDIQMGFPKLPDAGSITHLKVLKEWIRCCDNTHQCYPKNINFLPTRLLDVSDNDPRIIRLLTNRQGHNEWGEYVALSHRWGPPQQHAKFCTYKSNIEELARGIDVARLPKTFQDAVHVTRGLGLHLLWIDSLCIVQDDQDDWETESKFMERVFSSAYCTIAASCAKGTSDGFLKPRPERQCVTMQRPNGDGTYYVCAAIDDFYRDVDQGELNQRGWVLQERALSRRTIYFTETKSYWECGGGVRCETMTQMKNRKASFLGDSNFPNSAEKYVKGMRIELFQDLYERYSKLALSFPSDRPIAIKGLESRLLSTFGTIGGFGVFDKYLHRCLLWQRVDHILKRIEPARGGSPVPSWSWMAYDGPIRYMAVPFGQASWCDDIISPFVKTEQSDDCRGDGGITELEAPVWDIVDAHGGQIILDEPSRIFTRPFQCVVVGKSKTEALSKLQAYYVLLVYAGENEIHERIGVGNLNQHDIVFDKSHKKARIC